MEKAEGGGKRRQDRENYVKHAFPFSTE